MNLTKLNTRPKSCSRLLLTKNCSITISRIISRQLISTQLGTTRLKSCFFFFFIYSQIFTNMNNILTNLTNVQNCSQILHLFFFIYRKLVEMVGKTFIMESLLKENSATMNVSVTIHIDVGMNVYQRILACRNFRVMAHVINSTR